MEKLQFGNIEQIKQAKEAVISANIGQAFDHLHLALCEKDNLSKSEEGLYDHMVGISDRDDFSCTDGYSETKP